MRNPFARPLKKLLAALFIFTIYSVAVEAKPSPQDKLKTEDVVAKHLAAIGSAEDLAAVKSIIAIGKNGYG